MARWGRAGLSAARVYSPLPICPQPPSLALPLHRSPRIPSRLFRFFLFLTEEASAVFPSFPDAALCSRWMPSVASSVRVARCYRLLVLAFPALVLFSLCFRLVCAAGSVVGSS